ncbi:ATP-binding cassette domain-containing protein [Xenorhabdus taiwanensis]
MRDQVDKLYLNFQHLIDGSKELKLNRKKGHAFIEEVISPGTRKFKKTCISLNNNHELLLNSGVVVFYLVIGLIIFVIPLWLPQTPSTLVTAILIVLFLSGPINEVISTIPEMRSAKVSLNKMKILDDELIIESTFNLANNTNQFMSDNPLVLELKNITHQYITDKEDKPFTLGPLNLTIYQGEIVFIVGGNGSGKTTLAMLLVGLFEQEFGIIFLNKIKMGRTNNIHYRQYFSAIFSNYHLFDELLNPRKFRHYSFQNIPTEDYCVVREIR